MSEIQTEQKQGYCIGTFSAMACPCEILVETDDLSLTKNLTQLAFNEARRIEYKFSRYRKDNIIHRINSSHGECIEVDTETALMLNFAEQCYQLSDGKFDVTSGILRAVWKFDGSDNLPSDKNILALLPYIGWNRVNWKSPRFCLPDKMEIDLGGIGKEYAVDSSVKLLSEKTSNSFLVNYGGDIACPKPRMDEQPWVIGVDDPDNTGEANAGAISLYQGGLATSGDARRYLYKDGRRYSHILNPKTGYPVENAPRSVTVIANTCIEAGMLSTFAMLEGRNAIDFLKAQQVKYWCIP